MKRFFLAALLLAPSLVHAQHVRVAADRDTVAHRKPDPWGGLLGIHGGAPAKLSAGIGMIYITGRDADSREGYGLVLEPGLGAGRASLTYAEYDRMGTALQLRLSALRTWRSPSKVGRNQTYVGPELRYTPILVTIGAGYYWRLAGDVSGQDKFFASTIGLMF
jgi:hypothetical protein